jgi:hypothetical protein
MMTKTRKIGCYFIVITKSEKKYVLVVLKLTNQSELTKSTPTKGANYTHLEPAFSINDFLDVVDGL